MAHDPHGGAARGRGRHRHRLHPGVGRIVGESAALLYTAGFGLELVGFVKALHTSSATLTVALYVYATEGGEMALAFSIAAILMVLTLLINLTASLVGRKLRKK